MLSIGDQKTSRIEFVACGYCGYMSERIHMMIKTIHTTRDYVHLFIKMVYSELFFHLNSKFGVLSDIFSSLTTY